MYNLAVACLSFAAPPEAGLTLDALAVWYAVATPAGRRLADTSENAGDLTCDMKWSGVIRHTKEWAEKNGCCGLWWTISCPGFLEADINPEIGAYSACGFVQDEDGPHATLSADRLAGQVDKAIKACPAIDTEGCDDVGQEVKGHLFEFCGSTDSAAVAQAMVAYADKSGDGAVNYAEFAAIMNTALAQELLACTVFPRTADLDMYCHSNYLAATPIAPPPPSPLPPPLPPSPPPPPTPTCIISINNGDACDRGQRFEFHMTEATGGTGVVTLDQLGEYPEGTWYVGDEFVGDVPADNEAIGKKQSEVCNQRSGLGTDCALLQNRVSSVSMTRIGDVACSIKLVSVEVSRKGDCAWELTIDAGAGPDAVVTKHTKHFDGDAGDKADIFEAYMGPSKGDAECPSGMGSSDKCGRGCATDGLWC